MCMQWVRWRGMQWASCGTLEFLPCPRSELLCRGGIEVPQDAMNNALSNMYVYLVGRTAGRPASAGELLLRPSKMVRAPSKCCLPLGHCPTAPPTHHTLGIGAFAFL